MTKEYQHKLIAIVGGSGSGKTWLADRLQRALGPEAACLSLDDFYLDCSHLPPSRRAQMNFDHPRAIDWPCVERVLRNCRAGRDTWIPRYSFVTHTRHSQTKPWKPPRLVLIEGLWLLWRPTIRDLFALRIFLECPAQLRLERRLGRDVTERGRTPDSVREQFWKTVTPMHDLYVAPQTRWADLILKQPPSETDLDAVMDRILALAPGMSSAAGEPFAASHFGSPPDRPGWISRLARFRQHPPPEASRPTGSRSDRLASRMKL